MAQRAFNGWVHYSAYRIKCQGDSYTKCAGICLFSIATFTRRCKLSVIYSIMQKLYPHFPMVISDIYPSFCEYYSFCNSKHRSSPPHPGAKKAASLPHTVEKEVTLGCRFLCQPRVTSVNFWYLTSLVNPSFLGSGAALHVICSIDPFRKLFLFT